MPLRDPERALLDRSVSDDVQRALDSLPEDFRTAVVLCDVEGMAYKDIADIMECPVGTVMSRLFRGRKLLAASLRDFAISEGYVKPETAESASDKASASGTIDLQAYRNAQGNAR